MEHISMDFQGNQDEWMKPVSREREKETAKRADECVLLFVRKAERNGWKGEAQKMNGWREQGGRGVGVETRTDGLDGE